MTQTLQANKTNFNHNGVSYDYSAIVQLKLHRATDTLWLQIKGTNGAVLEELTIQSCHVSAFMLGYSRWYLNMI